MKKVKREDVVAREEYEKIRSVFRARVMAQKDVRRIHLGEHLTFLFENHDTVLYQVQEMMRAERMDGENEIQHEIETYNELLGDQGELGCTLLIEIDDPKKRDDLLARWLDLPTKIRLETEGGRQVAAVHDVRQVGERRASSVQYLKFKVGDGVPAKIVCDHPELKLSVSLTAQQSAALAQDLMSRD